MSYSKTSFVSINPTTEEIVCEVPMDTKQEVQAKLELSLKTYNEYWKDTTFEQRADILNKVAAEMRANLDEYAIPMTLEMGKPIKEARAEVEKSAWCAEHYAKYAKSYLKQDNIESDATLSYVQYLPLGPTLGILPWNAPFWLAFRYIAPALMAGNTCVMKHDSHTPKCAEVIVQAFTKAGAHEGILQNLTIASSDVESVMRHPIITAISFTGSVGTGSKIGAIAGSEIKPCVLELGGSDPAIVLSDADLESAADIISLSRMINAGQSCIAAKRIIVEEPIYDEFIEMLKVRFERLKMGDPMDESTDIGPIARKELVHEMHQQVKRSIDAGAKLVLGGKEYTGKGYFYPATLLVDVNPGMVVSCQETFGPIGVVIKAKNAEEALKIANDTEFGLGASVWTDVKRGEEIARKIVSGQVSVNGIVKTDPRLPSGGVKKSGLGRELGPHGIKMFVNAQQIWIGPKKG
ncbi:MAG: NAD-dependent succinate-semialdehyde dehydrogenase [Sulfurospirillaceae bacterium]|nr:NAD-dependent succinate-semialdehyde dehydrogenase [Sulfurospirillaceae bacterium]